MCVSLGTGCLGGEHDLALGCPQRLFLDCQVRAGLKEGYRKGGCSHLLASALSLRTAGPARVLSHKCDIPSLLKDDQIARDNHLPARCRHLQSLRHGTVIPIAMQISLTPLCLPPVETCPKGAMMLLRSHSTTVLWSSDKSREP